MTRRLPKLLALPGVAPELLIGIFIRRDWCDWVKCSYKHEHFCPCTLWINDKMTIAVRHCKQDKNGDWRPYGDRYCVQEIAQDYEKQGNSHSFASSEAKLFVQICSNQDLRRVIPW